MIIASILGPRIDRAGTKDLIGAGEAVILSAAAIDVMTGVSLTITDLVTNGEAS